MATADEHLAARRILAVTEEELQRIILDIHDGPVQKLFAALSQLNLLEARARHDAVPQDQLLPLLSRISSLLESSLGEIKTSLGTFRPPEFARRDLLSVIEGLIIQHEEFTGSPVDFAAEGDLPAVSLPVKIALYRLLQEALSNVYRHAEVKRVKVRLSAHGQQIRLEVVDTGRGFNPPPLVGPQATERVEHIGLRGMRERAALAGGTLTIESAPGAGTRVVVAMPAGE
jgi:signal transduction histidine kinase